MTAKTLRSKLADLESLKAKLAAAEAEITGARESVIDRVAELFEAELIAELTAMEITKLTISFVDDEVKVALQAGGNGNGGNGGAKAAEYWEKYQAGQTISQIAKEYGVRASTVSSAIKPFRAAASE